MQSIKAIKKKKSNKIKCKKEQNKEKFLRKLSRKIQYTTKTNIFNEKLKINR